MFFGEKKEKKYIKKTEGDKTKIVFRHNYATVKKLQHKSDFHEKNELTF